MFIKLSQERKLPFNRAVQAIMNINMLGSLEGARSDIEAGSHSETTEVLLTLLSQNKALGGK